MSKQFNLGPRWRYEGDHLAPHLVTDTYWALIGSDGGDPKFNETDRYARIRGTELAGMTEEQAIEYAHSVIREALK